MYSALRGNIFKFSSKNFESFHSCTPSFQSCSPSILDHWCSVRLFLLSLLVIVPADWQQPVWQSIGIWNTIHRHQQHAQGIERPSLIWLPVWSSRSSSASSIFSSLHCWCGSNHSAFIALIRALQAAKVSSPLVQSGIHTNWLHGSSIELSALSVLFSSSRIFQGNLPDTSSELQAKKIGSQYETSFRQKLFSFQLWVHNSPWSTSCQLIFSISISSSSFPALLSRFSDFMNPIWSERLNIQFVISCKFWMD